MLVCVIWKCSAWGLLSVPRLLLCGCKMTRLSALLFGLKIQLKSLWEKSLMNGLKSLNFFLPCYGEKKNTSTLGGLLCELNWAPQKTMQIHDSIYLDRQTLLEFNGRRVCLAMIRRYKRHCLKLVKFAFEESSEIPLLWTSGSQMNFELASHFRSLLFPLFADGQKPCMFLFLGWLIIESCVCVYLWHRHSLKHPGVITKAIKPCQNSFSLLLSQTLCLLDWSALKKPWHVIPVLIDPVPALDLLPQPDCQLWAASEWGTTDPGAARSPALAMLGLSAHYPGPLSILNSLSLPPPLLPLPRPPVPFSNIDFCTHTRTHKLSFTCIYTHTHHTDFHTDFHTHIEFHMHRHVHTLSFTCTDTYTHWLPFTDTHTLSFTCADRHMPNQAHSHIYTYTHTDPHTLTSTHMHTQTHTHTHHLHRQTDGTFRNIHTCTETSISLTLFLELIWTAWLMQVAEGK